MSPISSRKSVPPWACSKKPRLRACGAGERALLVAEELALDELARDRGAVHLDERRLAARREPVDGAAMSSLPVPLSPVMSTLALRRRDLLDLVEEPLHRRALADHLVARAQLLRADPPPRERSLRRARARSSR